MRGLHVPSTAISTSRHPQQAAPSGIHQLAPKSDVALPVLNNQILEEGLGIIQEFKAKVCSLVTDKTLTRCATAFCLIHLSRQWLHLYGHALQIDAELVQK